MIGNRGACNRNRMEANSWRSNGEDGVGEAKVKVVRFLMDFGGFMEMGKEEFLILIHARGLKHDILFYLVHHGSAQNFFMSYSICCPIQ